MTAHALCRCAEAGGTAACPVHGSQSSHYDHGDSYPQQQTRTVASGTGTPLPLVLCAVCAAPLPARWDHGAIGQDAVIVVEPHHCPTDTVRIIDAAALTDDELLDAVRARGLVVGS